MSSDTGTPATLEATVTTIAGPATATTTGDKPATVTSEQDSSVEPVKTRYFIRFNQDSSAFVIASPDGFRVFSLHNLDELHLIHCDVQPTYMIERLFNSSLIALVTTDSVRQLHVCHFRKTHPICNYNFSSPILAVHMNRARLIVCLETCLYVHNVRDMKMLHHIRDTPTGARGVCALSANTEESLLAYPASRTIGEVQIFNAEQMKVKFMISAHNSPLAAIAFDLPGLRMATASDKGTVIRVFNTTDGTKLFEFRRGVKRCVDICSLTFSPCTYYLCCSSNTETVHVFKLDAKKTDVLPPSGRHGFIDSNDGPESSTGWIDYFSSYLPTQIADVINMDRAHATVHLPIAGIRSVANLLTVGKQLHLLVATEEGDLYIYKVNTIEGGEATLYKHHRIDGFENHHMDPEVLRQYNEIKAGTAVGICCGSSEDGAETNATNFALLSSYAGILKGNRKDQMSASDKMYTLLNEIEPPPANGFRLNDEDEYPPLAQLLV